MNAAPPLPPGSPPLPEPSFFAASDGYRPAYRLWRPAADARGLVVALHGIQSHSGWYGWSSARLAEAGYAVAFLDRRGSGVNDAARGDAVHAERLIHDVLQFAAHLERGGMPPPGRPRTLLAVSWGGKLAAAVAATHPDRFDGLALLYPALRTKVRASGPQRAAIRLATSLGAGLRPVPVPLDDPALFTGEAAFQEFVQSDPLALKRVTVRFLAATLALDEIARRRSGMTRCRSLLMLAGGDAIVDNAATRSAYEAFGSPDRTVLEYADARHTLEFEPGRDRIFDDLIAWLDRDPRSSSRTSDHGKAAPG